MAIAKLVVLVCYNFIPLVIKYKIKFNAKGPSCLVFSYFHSYTCYTGRSFFLLVWVYVVVAIVTIDSS